MASDEISVEVLAGRLSSSLGECIRATSAGRSRGLRLAFGKKILELDESLVLREADETRRSATSQSDEGLRGLTSSGFWACKTNYVSRKTQVSLIDLLHR